MIQQRAPGEKRWYSPDRDMAYCWQSMVRAAANGLAAVSWEDWFRDYFAHSGLTEDQIGEAMVVYIKSIVKLTEPGISSHKQALEECGWFNLHPAAQIAVLMRLGQVATASFFTCIRDVTIEGEAPPLAQAKLMDEAMKIEEVLRAKRESWPRRLWKWMVNKLGRRPGNVATIPTL